MLLGLFTSQHWFLFIAVPVPGRAALGLTELRRQPQVGFEPALDRAHGLSAHLEGACIAALPRLRRHFLPVHRA